MRKHNYHLPFFLSVILILYYIIPYNMEIKFTPEQNEKFNQAAIRNHKDNTKLQHRAMRESGHIKCPYCERYLAQLD